MSVIFRNKIVIILFNPSYYFLFFYKINVHKKLVSCDHQQYIFLQKSGRVFYVKKKSRVFLPIKKIEKCLFLLNLINKEPPPFCITINKNQVRFRFKSKWLKYKHSLKIAGWNVIHLPSQITRIYLSLVKKKSLGHNGSRHGLIHWAN